MDQQSQQWAGPCKSLARTHSSQAQTTEVLVNIFKFNLEICQVENFQPNSQAVPEMEWWQRASCCRQLKLLSCLPRDPPHTLHAALSKVPLQLWVVYSSHKFLSFSLPRACWRYTACFFSLSTAAASTCRLLDQKVSLISPFTSVFSHIFSEK